MLENHPSLRASAADAFRRLGCREVLEADNSGEALRLLQDRGPVQVVLCGLWLVGVEGLAFLRRSRGLVESVILHGWSPPELRQAALQVIRRVGLELLGEADTPLQPELLRELLGKRSHAAPQPNRQSFDCPVESAVRKGLTEGEFTAYYQPKFDIASGSVTGVEVLARWRHPTRGLLLPSDFMPVIERCCWWDELLFALLEQGLALQSLLKSQGYPLTFSFNLDASQLAVPGLDERVEARVRSHRLPSSGITFELTETAPLEHAAISLDNMARLRRSGFGLSIDDFGVGFSSLQRLCQLPFTEIKLDASFIRGLGTHPTCVAVIESTLVLARMLDMTVVAEGVETRAQHRQLLDMGCTQGQGFFYSESLTGLELTSRLAASHPVPVG
ncbi:EAL domain-containing protein [Zobellella sp. DQSA1]|uniref:EAL domain-containing response regulator n=1 Tax=Zobellella sp. DQSA1 TaxID=3342386 RepID=UPI0035BEE431